jgi:hypothetical protein
MGPAFEIDGHQVELGPLALSRPSRSPGGHGRVARALRARRRGCAPCSTRATCRRSSCPTWTRRPTGTPATSSTSANTPRAGSESPSCRASTARRARSTWTWCSRATTGVPRTVPSVICLFERYAGDPLWRHGGDAHEGRAERDLVVRMAAVLGNYDYIVDWVFRQDGAIKVQVGATGIVEAKPVIAANAVTVAEMRNGMRTRRRLRPLRGPAHRGGEPRPLLQLPPRHGGGRRPELLPARPPRDGASPRRPSAAEPVGRELVGASGARPRRSSTWTCTARRSGG